MGRVVVRSTIDPTQFRVPDGTTLRHTVHNQRMEIYDYVLEGEALPAWAPGVEPQQWTYAQVQQIVRRAEFT